MLPQICISLKPQEVRSQYFLLELIQQVPFRERAKTRFQGRQEETESSGNQLGGLGSENSPADSPRNAPSHCARGLPSVVRFQAWRTHCHRKQGVRCNLRKSLRFSEPPCSHLSRGKKSRVSPPPCRHTAWRVAAWELVPTAKVSDRQVLRIPLGKGLMP